jgi:4-amino-4-deoxy-L-arabinose transferase-like glycosyltransferase
MNKLQKNIVLLSIALISFLMHYNHFSKDLISIHAWRQTYTQTTINNFYEEDMSILNPRKNDRGNTDGVYRMEFPLMQWIVASVYKITGNHIVVSRIIMFLIGMLSVAGIYCLLKNLFNNLNLAIIGAWAFNFSPSFYYYTINPMPDNLALCCSIWGLALFFSWIKNNNIYHLFISGILLSIGTLCKLPFITFYMVPIVYFPLHFSKNKLNKKQLSESISVLGFILAPLSWYLYVIPGWKGNPIVKGMFDNSESAGNLVNYLLHNTISTLPELLLNYGSLPFFFSGFYFLFKNKKLNNTKFYMLLGLCLSTVFYYLFELNAIARVHDYYLFPFYPILFIIVAYGAYNMITHSQTLKYITFMLLLLLPFTCYLRMKDRWNIESP